MYIIIIHIIRKDVKGNIVSMFDNMNDNYINFD